MSSGGRQEDPSKEPWPRWRRPSVSSRAVRTTRLEDQTKLDAYHHLERVIGKGAFGVVYLATSKEAGEYVAIKIVTKAEAGTHGVQMMENELSILKKVSHPHIVLLKEVFETSQRTMMVMEYCCQGDLESELKRRKRFSAGDTKTVMTRLSSAVAYMHDNGMVHRDLKLENILLKETGGDRLYIKVTDFGLSCMVGSGSSSDAALMQSYCGTPLYMAPEVLCSIRTYTKQCDIWSMGVIMFLLLAGVPPFRGSTRAELTADIEKGKVSLAGSLWDATESGAKRLLLSMLEKSPAKRIAAKEVERHPWITGRAGEYTGTVLEMMSEMNKSMKISVEDEEDTKENDEGEEGAAAAAAATHKSDDADGRSRKSTSSLHPLKNSKSKSVSSLSAPNGTARPMTGKKAPLAGSASVPSYMQPTRASATSAMQTKQRLAQGPKVPPPSRKA